MENLIAILEKMPDPRQAWKIKHKISDILLICLLGGIIGLGENWEQRLELAFALKELDVDSVPINVLNPVKGTCLVR